MTEGSKDAAILIAVSFQALSRAKNEQGDKLFTDCTVTILFAGFYVEATLNYILEATGFNISTFPSSQDRRQGHSTPGLNDKFKYFYNEFLLTPKADNWRDLRDRVTSRMLDQLFPGIRPLIDFRNDTSHGVINMDAMNLENAKRLRQQAKDIVNQLYQICESKGYRVSRLTTYKDAIAAIHQPLSELVVTSGIEVK